MTHFVEISIWCVAYVTCKCDRIKAHHAYKILCVSSYNFFLLAYFLVQVALKCESMATLSLVVLQSVHTDLTQVSTDQGKVCTCSLHLILNWIFYCLLVLHAKCHKKTLLHVLWCSFKYSPCSIRG